MDKPKSHALIALLNFNTVKDVWIIGWSMSGDAKESTHAALHDWTARGELRRLS